MSADTLSREQLLALRPEFYLEQGYREPSGAPRPELTGLWAVAAAEQLRAAGVQPAQLDPLIAAVSKLALANAAAPLPLPDREALQESVAQIQAPRAAKQLILGCIGGLKDREDLRPFVAHLAAILRTLALVGALGSAPDQTS